MARNKTSKAWMHEHVTDPYVRQAKHEGYRSRAAYKLRELAQQDRLIKPGMVVIDLGSAPGGWSQVAADLVGPKGRVLAVDILAMQPVAGVEFIQGDFREDAALQALEAKLAGAKVDLVLSDMSPNISGIGMVDQAKSARLAELALEFALKWLKPEGNMLVKAFQGEAYSGLREQMRGRFRQVLARKPQASRSRSAETYLLARGLKDGEDAGPGTPAPLE
jgi:23S rRNA (uridine2552-2'-O)-methyltransferase